VVAAHIAAIQAVNDTSCVLHLAGGQRFEIADSAENVLKALKSAKK
jgi:hypothetical protein